MTLDAIVARPWRKILAAYQQPSLFRSIVEILISAAPLAALFAGGWVAVAFGHWWLGLLLSVPAALFLVRLFMVQHDCGHQALFKSPTLNNWVGRIIGVFTLTPYDCWRQTHAIHHATSGNLDRRGLGGLLTLTVEEYQAKGFWGRLGYRLYRNPLVLFGLGPAYMFLIEQRLPVGLMRAGWRPWVSAMGTNAALLALAALIVWLGGWQVLLLVSIPMVVIGATIGMWLFYVQHQFEGGHWSRQDDWDLTEAALRGSSHYHLPQPLRWITANIGVHHVHHINSRIPFYRLPKVLRDHPELNKVSRLTLGQSLKCISLTLWDEAGQRLVDFGRARRLPAPQIATPAVQRA